MVVGQRHEVRRLQFVGITVDGEIGVVKQIGVILAHEHNLVANGAAGIKERAQRARMVQRLDVGVEVDVVNRHQAVDGEARNHVEAHRPVGLLAQQHPAFRCAHHYLHVDHGAIAHTGALVGD